MEKRKMYFIVDQSGSMESNKRGIYQKVYDFIKEDYSLAKAIGFTTVANEYLSVKDIKPESGGTYISSGLKFALGDIAAKEIGNAKIFLISDGDNWTEDNPQTFALIKNLIETYGAEIEYIEICPSSFSTPMSARFKRHLGDLKGKLSIRTIYSAEEYCVKEKTEIEVMLEKIEELESLLKQEREKNEKYEEILEELERVLKVGIV